MDNPGRTISVKKLDAAINQLDCAIELWFSEGDEISIHTLAHSAFQIIHDINTAEGKEGLLYDADVISDEYKKAWRDTLRAPGNFFKHADKDRDGVLEFMPSLSLLFMMSAARGLERFGLKSRHDRTLFLWIVIHRRNWLKAGFIEKLNLGLSDKDIDEFKSIPRKQIFEVLGDARPMMGSA